MPESARTGEREQAHQQAWAGHAQAVAAAGDPIKLERQAVEHLRERERQDAEEDLRMAHANISQQRRSDGNRRHADQDVELHRMRAEILNREGDAVGADAEIGRMAERQQSGVAEQQVEPERGDRRDQAVGQELHLVGFEIRRKQDQNQQDQSRHSGEPYHRTIAKGLDFRFHHAVPNNPVGRTSSTNAAIK